MTNSLQNCCLFLFLSAVSCISFPAFAGLPPQTGNNNTLKQLKYVFTYLNNNKTPILNVSLEFKTGQEEKTIIELPSDFGGVSELYKNITDITVNGARIAKTATPNRLVLYHMPRQDIILSYKVKQGWDGALNDFQHFHAPILQKQYFQFVGNGVLLYPLSYKDEKKIALSLDWKIPRGWKIANSYGDNNVHQNIFSPLDDVLYGLFISGDYRIYKVPVRGGVISTAIQGKWPFQEKKFSKMVANIITSERSFWNDYDFPRFLVSLVPVETDKKGMGGTSLKNAFMTALKSNYFPGYPLWYVIAHECFHTWNTPSLFETAGEKQEANYYWFSEGFTDYYANLLNLRAGLITLTDYIKEYNKTLAEYYSSPVNSSTIEEVNASFWKNPDMQKLPYQQGTILANNWNVQIKKATHNQYSLDDLMRAFVLFVKEHSKLTLNKMNSIAKQYKKEKLVDDVRDIYAGHLMVADENSLGPCVYQINKMLAPYDRGFHINPSRKKTVITSVNPKSKGFAAGLRNGQLLISLEEHPDDISKMMKITVKDNNLVKIIKYYPYKGELKSIPQFILDQKKWATQPEQCLAWFK